MVEGRTSSSQLHMYVLSGMHDCVCVYTHILSEGKNNFLNQGMKNYYIVKL